MIEDNIITKEYYNEFLKADLVTIYLWISIKNTRKDWRIQITFWPQLEQL